MNAVGWTNRHGMWVFGGNVMFGLDVGPFANGPYRVHINGFCVWATRFTIPFFDFVKWVSLIYATGNKRCGDSTV